ncbi:hypothetical protein CFAEC_09695 [Corynebacterium faecale]|uniref:hypothetical protein n=1 Tax=Corynebacterium faecale TaxID=1758466 RepID=UPI0025B3B7AE|nr:hypothetical protein [Corynebacterium faecale]WJY92756.1 hypothetical protein CFAEC_09695 [Corynebacterium faecale]
MAIKITIDLSEATFAELSAVIGYAHQLGADPDEKLTFDGGVLTIEFDGDLQHDDLFTAFGEGLDEDDIQFDSPEDLDGPLYVEDFVDTDDLRDHSGRDEYRGRRSHRDSSPADDVINDIGEAVNKLVQGFMGDRDGHGGRGGRGRGYGDFGGFGGPAGPFGPFGPFGPRNRF